MRDLKENPTLDDLQEYVAVLEQVRGFGHEDIIKKCLLLGEEVGELFKAIRKTQRIGIDPCSKVGTVEEELADILIHVCTIANRHGISLEKAFREKEAINQTRRWE